MNPNDTPNPAFLNLAKAIGQTESGGNYNASGDNGNSQGAYQMGQGFIEKWAPASGVQYQPGQSLDPESQNKIAYNAVKTMATSGDPNYQHLGPLSAAQIASDWNAGDPNAYLDPNYGKNNAYGSTQNYVSQVEKNYGQLSGSQTSQSPQITQPSKSPSMMDWLTGAGAAGVGWLMGAGGGLLKQGLPIAGAVAGGAIEPAGGEIAGGLIGEGLASLIPGGSAPQTNGPDSGGSNTPQEPNIEQEIAALEAGGQGASIQSRELTQGLQAMLSSTMTGRQMLQDPQTQAGIQAAGIYGLAPHADASGNVNALPAMQKADQVISTLHQGAMDALGAEGAVAPTTEWEERAKKNVRITMPSTDWKEADGHIDDVVNQYQSNFGAKDGSMDLAHLQLAKQELGHGKKWGVLDSTAKKNAYKAASTAARQTIEKHTQHKELYNRVMKEEQKLINAKHILKKLNGKKSPKNNGLMKSLRHTGAALASAFIGDKIGGPIGAVVGSMVGDHLASRIDQKYGKTILQTPAFKKMMQHLDERSPASYQVLTAHLKKAGISYPAHKGKNIKQSRTPEKIRHSTPLAQESKTPRPQVRPQPSQPKG